MWQSLVEKPVFVLTSDQDWTPAWAAERFLAELNGRGIFNRNIPGRNIPVHFFRTNPCPILDSAAADGRITQGWHPNFLPGSSHGDDIDSVIDYMSRTFPGATTARSHAFVESTFSWLALVRAGIVADSQIVTLCQPGLTPLLHHTGIVRFPIFFEDDVFYEYESDRLNLDVVKANLFTPGLKILNFHATFVAANIPSTPYYNQVKSSIFADDSQPHRYDGRGTCDVFEELLQTIFEGGFEFISFPQLVKSAFDVIEANRDKFPRPLGGRVLAREGATSLS